MCIVCEAKKTAFEVAEQIYSLVGREKRVNDMTIKTGPRRSRELTVSYLMSDGWHKQMSLVQQGVLQ